MVNENSHGKAVASLVLGIIACVFLFTGVGSAVSLILGIVGLILAGKAKKDGNIESIRTAGFILSLIGLIAGAIEVSTLVFTFGVINSVASAYLAM